ncbi:MAG TPA: hypothetical protein VF316_05825 [Polyangiaceae bacterium]
MSRRVVFASVVLVLGALALAAEGCSTTGTSGDGGTCTSDEVKKCDADLSACIAKPPCDNPADPGYQACVDACSNAQCDCQRACGNTCTKK